MSTLDINTPKGQITLNQEERAIEIFNHHYPDLKYIETPKNRPATVDALLIENNSLCCVVETKCRHLTSDKLRMYGSTWLITREKVDKARAISMGLGIPFWGFLYLVPEDSLIVVKITDDTGCFVVDINDEMTRTQETVNGGSIVRKNAFINVSGSLQFTIDDIGVFE